jgi:hypothetical protein
MYYYVFESVTQPTDLERSAAIRHYVSSLGIAGELVTWQQGRNLDEMIRQAIAKRYSTVVAVGSLATINAVARSLEPYDVVFGIIPLFSHPDITHLIGTSEWQEAAEHLKRRRWQHVRLGIMNESSYFLTPAHIALRGPAILRTAHYEAAVPGGTITIRLPESGDEHGGLHIEAAGREAGARSLLGRIFKGASPAIDRSYFVTDRMEIETPTLSPVLVAGTEITHTPLTVTTQDKPLKLIVAKSGT